MKKLPVNINAIIDNAEKILGMSTDGTLKPVPNYTVLIEPLYQYLVDLESRVQELEKQIAKK